MSCSRSCPVWAQTHRALPAVSPGRCQAQPCPNTRSPKQREPCARRGWHVPLVLPAAPLRSCDNRGHQRPLLRRAVPCPGRAGLLPAVRTRGRKEPASPVQPAPPVRGTAAGSGPRGAAGSAQRTRPCWGWSGGGVGGSGVQGGLTPSAFRNPHSAPPAWRGPTLSSAPRQKSLKRGI